MNGRCAVAGMVILAVGFTAGAARATDGVIEINQAKVMANGGFPFQISAGGSYRLTSNLDILAGGQPNPEDLHGISVNVASEPKQVEIDFNGFSLIGPFVCTHDGESLSCPPAASTGSGFGILANNVPLRVHDGAVQGFAGNGIAVQLFESAAHTTQIRNMDLRWNHNGIVVYSAIVENVTTAQNRGQGIYAAMSVLRGILSFQNGDDGINLQSYSMVQTCSSSGNVGDAIQSEAGVLIVDCTTDAP